MINCNECLSFKSGLIDVSIYHNKINSPDATSPKFSAVMWEGEKVTVLTSYSLSLQNAYSVFSSLFLAVQHARSDWYLQVYGALD